MAKKAKKARRGRGEGSIFQRANGQWASTISAGYGLDGKRIRKTVYGATKGEVQDKLTKLQGQKIDGTLTNPSTVTVGEYLDTWLATSVKGKRRSMTHYTYVRRVEAWIKPKIGGIKLAKLLPGHIDAMNAALAADGLEAGSRRNAHTILRSALQRAYKTRLIPGNPCDFVERPTYSSPDVHPMTESQAGLLLKSVEGTDIGTCIVLALTSGIREGEILGLQWADLDLNAGTLQVRRTLFWLAGKWGTNDPKNAKSKRTITLAGMAVEALRSHMERATLEGKLAFPWIFCDPKGDPYKARSMLYEYKACLKAAGLPDFRFHDLRHTSASLLLTAGVHPKVVQERLGHARIGITLDTYSHVVPAMHSDASSKFDDMFGKKSESGEAE